MLWRLAWRNLWRNRARTMTLLSAVALVYALLLLGIAIMDDMQHRLLGDAARAAGGEVLVHGDEYWQTRASDVVIPDAERVLEATRGVEGVRVAIPRVLANGLAGTAVDTRPVQLAGIDPALESALDDLSADLVAGTFLEVETTPSPAMRRAPIVLGARLAERLGVEPGDRVVFTGTRPDGEVTRALFHLSGIVRTGQRQLDEVVGYTTLEAAQRALGMEGMLTQIGILAEPGTDAETLAVMVREALTGPGIDSPDPGEVDLTGTAAGDAAGTDRPLEVLSWREAVPEMVGFLEIDAAFALIIGIVLYVVVLFSITNTFLMAVMERVREFGLLNALGMRGRGIGTLLLAETALLVLLAIGTGLTVALVGHAAIDHWGIDVAMYGIEEMELSGIDMADLVVHSRIVPMKWVVSTLLITLATVAAALYPAWRAARLAPAEAMRFYE